MLRLQNVSRWFGGVAALNDVSFSMQHGELVGLIGPNGSGKSTLVNVVSGMIRATSGAVFFRDVEITAARTARIVGLGISRNFQSPRLFGA